MADKPDKKPDAAAAAPAAEKKEGAAKKGGGLLTKTPVLMGAAMIIEAVVLFGGFKFLGGGSPKTAAGAETTDDHGDGHGDPHGDGHGGGKDAAKSKDKKMAEVQILELRAFNTVSGRKLLFDVMIVMRVKAEHEESVKQKIADNKALITDRVGTIMRQSDPEKLGGGSEPGLETFRRQVKYQLEDILGPGIVDEVLVPGASRTVQTSSTHAGKLITGSPKVFDALARTDELPAARERRERQTPTDGRFAALRQGR